MKGIVLFSISWFFSIFNHTLCMFHFVMFMQRMKSVKVIVILEASTNT